MSQFWSLHGASVSTHACRMVLIYCVHFAVSICDICENTFVGLSSRLQLYEAVTKSPADGSICRGLEPTQASPIMTNSVWHCSLLDGNNMLRLHMEG